MSSAIRVTGLRKSFRVNHSGASSLKSALLWRRRGGIEQLEVLRGITFEVNKGEAVAIVGRNGAGKSTLLSLLARVYKPTAGTIEIEGRVAPLLELGAGFHPDLTGVQNVFFNGVILGLTRKQVEARMDDIIEFSGLHRHISAPVRTYSSGMVARLGFAVAAHVDPDILIVDEVLSVGDLDFAKKCMEKVSQFRAEGRTILLVSHQLGMVREMADRCIWLKGGEIVMQGSPGEVLPEYTMGSGDPL